MQLTSVVHDKEKAIDLLSKQEKTLTAKQQNVGNVVQSGCWVTLMWYHHLVKPVSWCKLCHWSTVVKCAMVQVERLIRGCVIF